jgi:hypothetical protein
VRGHLLSRYSKSGECRSKEDFRIRNGAFCDMKIVYMYVVGDMVTCDVTQNILRSRNLPYSQPLRDLGKI